MAFIKLQEDLVSFLPEVHRWKRGLLRFVFDKPVNAKWTHDEIEDFQERVLMHVGVDNLWMPTAWFTLKFHPGDDEMKKWSEGIGRFMNTVNLMDDSDGEESEEDGRGDGGADEHGGGFGQGPPLASPMDAETDGRAVTPVRRNGKRAGAKRAAEGVP